MIHIKLLRRLLVLQIWMSIFLQVTSMKAQNGTYELKNTDGSYGLISLLNNQNKITAEIFTWWNTPSAQTGSYYGNGRISNNRVILKSDENDPDCITTLSITDRTITATFQKCTTDHLTEDFNGKYRKVSDATVGDYIIKADKTFFHSRPDEHSKQKAYLIKGDKVSFSLDGGAFGNWVFVHFRNKSGTDISGYIKLTDLKKL